jgi:hypothetical protein
MDPISVSLTASRPGTDLPGTDPQTARGQVTEEPTLRELPDARHRSQIIP